MPNFDLTGRVALVTGSSKGIGFSLSKGLAKAGARLVMNGRNEDDLEAAADTLRATGAQVDTLSFDVTDPTAVREAVNDYERVGQIDILINNAGMQHRGPLEDFETDAFDHRCEPM